MYIVSLSSLWYIYFSLLTQDGNMFILAAECAPKGDISKLNCHTVYFSLVALYEAECAPKGDISKLNCHTVYFSLVALYKIFNTYVSYYSLLYNNNSHFGGQYQQSICVCCLYIHY